MRALLFHFSVFFALFFFFAPFALARDGAPARQQLSVEEEEALLAYPLGATGRYTLEQAEIAALRTVRGEILGHNIWRDDERVFYDYRIETPRGSIFEVELNAYTLDVNDIEIELLMRGDALPLELFDKQIAKTSALNYVAENTRGVRKPQFRSLNLIVHQRKPVYDIRIKKSAQKYRVLLDAWSGQIVSMEEAD